MRQVALLILDGWGHSERNPANPIAKANIPTIAHIKRNYPMVLLQASGAAVGLPWGEAGNSEVGHLTLGTGRVLTQPLVVINKAVLDGSLNSNPNLEKAASHIQKNNGVFHIIGLLTSGSVHAHIKHLFALLKFAGEKGLKTYLHLFLDGKDSKLKEGVSLIQDVRNYIAQNNVDAKVASVVGRNYGMDRDSNWNLTQRAYSLLTSGEGNLVDDIDFALQNYYDSGITDESIPPTFLKSAIGEKANLKDGDAAILFNFREDSMRQLASAFAKKDFNHFQTFNLSNLLVTTIVPYSTSFKLPVLFDRPDIKSSLAEVIARQGIKQLHVAESEKYAHVTYFFNGLSESSFEGEDDILVPSLKNLVQNPQMRSREITKTVLEALDAGTHNFLVVNFANPDMLAHTGNYQAVVAGIEAVDQSLHWVFKRMFEIEDSLLIVTADHGNVENIIYTGSGEIQTSHDVNPVPCYLVGKGLEKIKSSDQIIKEESEVRGLLSDIAPTILDFMNIQIPSEMTGQSLLDLVKNQ